MASKTLLVVLALALVAATMARSFETAEEEGLLDALGEELTMEDLHEYFIPTPVEKRGSKVGSKLICMQDYNNNMYHETESTTLHRNSTRLSNFTQHQITKYILFFWTVGTR